MSPRDLLSEIQKMPLDELREVAERLEKYLHERESTAPTTEGTEAREDEFERQLLAIGVITQIPTRDETDEEFDKFDPIEVAGEPISETIIRERR